MVYTISMARPAHASITEEMKSCHNYDNPVYWHSDYLFMNIHQENLRDGAKQDRIAYKLSEEEVRAIRTAVISGEAQHSVASRFDTTQSYVSKIVLGKKHQLVDNWR